MCRFRSASTLLATPALISDWVPMIERCAAGAIHDDGGLRIRRTRPARSTSSSAGHADEPGMFMVAYSSNRRTSSTAILALLAISAATSSADNDGCAGGTRPDSPNAFGVGIHILKQFVARRLPGLQPAVELANVGVSQSRKAIRSLGNKAFARVVDDDRTSLRAVSFRLRARSCRPAMLAAKQRMAGGKGSLVPHIEQSRFQRAAAARSGLARSDGGGVMDGGPGSGRVLFLGHLGLNSPMASGKVRQAKKHSGRATSSIERRWHHVYCVWVALLDTMQPLEEGLP